MQMNYYELVDNKLMPIAFEINHEAIEDYKTQCAIHEYIDLGCGRYIKHANGKICVLIIED